MRGRAPLLLSLLAVALGAAALVVALTRDTPELVRVVRVQDAPTSDAFDKQAIVFCPDGYVAIGGGGNVPHGNDTPGVGLYWSAPYRNGWRVQAQDTARKTKPWLLSAVAVCVKGKDAERVAGGSLPAETIGG